MNKMKYFNQPTTAYPPGNTGDETPEPERIPSGNHVAMHSPTRRPYAAPDREKNCLWSSNWVVKVTGLLYWKQISLIIISS